MEKVEVVGAEEEEERGGSVDQVTRGKKGGKA